jgi:hypothetical protein
MENIVCIHLVFRISYFLFNLNYNNNDTCVCVYTYIYAIYKIYKQYIKHTKKIGRDQIRGRLQKHFTFRRYFGETKENSKIRVHNDKDNQKLTRKLSMALKTTSRLNGWGFCLGILTLDLNVIKFYSASFERVNRKFGVEIQKIGFFHAHSFVYFLFAGDLITLNIP